MSAPRRIPGVSVLSLDAPASLGSKDVWFGTTRTVVKYDDDEPGRSALVAVEFICTRLAMMVGLPVPMGDAAEFTQEGRGRPHKAWVSAEVVLSGITLPPPNPEQILAEWPVDLAGAYVFDLWTLNEDRTEENVLFHPGTGFWIIDHENALGGEIALDPDRLRRAEEQVPRWWLLDPNRFARGDLDEWVRYIGLNARRFAEVATEEAWRRRLITRNQQGAINSFLSSRGGRLQALMQRSLEQERRGGAPAWMGLLEPGTLFSSPPTSDGENPGTSA